MKRVGMVLLVTIVLLSLSAPTRAAPLASAGDPALLSGWKAEHPVVTHTFSNMGPRSLAIDTAGHLHYAYGGDHLYYTHNDGAGWAAPVIVDPDYGVGPGTALALDSAGKVHISYADTAARILRYATNKSGAWVVTTFPDNTDMDAHTALALDASGRPHILMHDSTDDTLTYYHLLATGTWEIYPLGEGGGEVAAAIGSDNVLQISYYRVKDATHGCLVYQARDAGGWTSAEELDCDLISEGAAGTVSAIALGSENHAYIAFNNVGNLSIRYTNGAEWAVVSVTGDPNLNSISIVMGASDRAHVLYNTSGMLKYGSFLGSWDWSAIQADNTGYMIDASLALDPGGLPHVTYLKSADGDLVSRAYESAAWQANEPIDTREAGVGPCTSLVYGENGRAHLTYFENGHIRYAYKDPGGSWVVSLQMIAPINPIACEHSLSVRGNTPALAYTMESGALRYAEYTCLPLCSWKTYGVVDSLAWVPESASLGFTSTGKPRISFVYSSQVYLAYNNGTSWGAGWEVSRVDAATADGQTSLIVDPDDRAHVAYFHSVDQDLYYAVQAGTSPVSWNAPQLVDANAAGTYVSLQLFNPVLNLAYVAYTGAGGTALRACQQGFTLKDGVHWLTPGTVSASQAEGPRLMLDSNSQPRLFWYSLADSHLHLSTKPGPGWDTQVLDGTLLAGRGLGLAVSPITGRPGLSYYDENVLGVKYIYELTPLFLPLLRK